MDGSAAAVDVAVAIWGADADVVGQMAMTGYALSASLKF